MRSGEGPRRLAFIPARGGSKRIPQKNVRPFFGHPMLAYAIAAARHSGLFDHVAVSTDDPEILRISSLYGADAVLRPEALATDGAGLPEVLLHLLEVLSLRQAPFQEVCLLMPNCPLRLSSDILEHHQAFVDQGRSFQISTVSYRCTYPHWALVRGEEGKPGWLFDPAKILVPSQGLKASVCPTGAIWWVRTEAFLRERAFYGKGFEVEAIDPNRGIDIDVWEDLELAELVVLGQQQRLGRSPLEPVDPLPVEGGAL